MIVDGFVGYSASRNILYKIDLRNGDVVWRFSAYGLISNLVYENGVLYFDSLDGSYNAVDLAAADKLAGAGVSLGTSNPKKESLKRRTYKIGVELPKP